MEWLHPSRSCTTTTVCCYCARWYASVQELHMAREGIDSESICPICSARGIQPIVTSSTAQQFGNSRRLIRFFCQSCCSMHNKVESAPMPPCSVPLDVWNSLRHIDQNSGPILARPVDSATFNAHADSGLYNNRTTGSGCKRREYCKYGPPI